MKKVFILGASQGIGLGLVKQFLQEGYQVVASSRSGQIEAVLSAHLEVVPLDVTNPDQISSLASKFQQEQQSFDVWINNAGIGPDLNQARPDYQSFRTTLAVNLEGIIFATEQLLPFLAEQGVLINVSSKMGSISNCARTTSVAYRVSKAGLNMYNQVLAHRLPKGQKVAVIHPGFVRTNISTLNDHAPLSPEDSAARIYAFLQSDFETGAYWDCQENEAIAW